MAITLSTAAKNTRCNAVVDLLDLGSTTATGKAVFKTSGGTTLGTVLLSNPAFGNASAGSATLSATTRDDVADATGTVATCEFQDRDNTVVFSVTVATTSGDGATMTMPTLSVTAGQPIEIGSLTYSEPT